MIDRLSITTTTLDGENKRIKSRLIMESTGVFLNECETDHEGLMAIYDVLEG
jgi:hypothetical protein